MYSTALPSTLALLIFLATLTPSTNPRSSTASPFPLAPFWSSKTLSAGTAARSDWIRALRFVRYLRSIVVWLVLDRPRTVTPGVVAGEAVGGAGEEQDDGDELGDDWAAKGARFKLREEVVSGAVEEGYLGCRE